MKLHRDLGITQKSAWHMLDKIRHALTGAIALVSATVVEVDETCIGGLERNKHDSSRLKAGRSGVGKTVVVGLKERESRPVVAQVVVDTKPTILHGFIPANAEQGTEVSGDDFISYQQLDGYRHKFVRRSVGEFAVGDVHINGIESYLSMIRRAHKGANHKMSGKHLGRYVSEFAGQHNIRELDTADQMAAIVAGFVGQHLMNEDLAAGVDGRLY